jgi:hypothetical protein
MRLGLSARALDGVEAATAGLTGLATAATGVTAAIWAAAGGVNFGLLVRGRRAWPVTGMRLAALAGR